MSGPAPASAGVDRVALRDLYDEYAHLLDAAEYEGWLDLFDEACEYRVTSRENFDLGLPLATMRCDSRAMLADRITALEGLQFYAPRIMRHFVSAVRPAGEDGTGVAVTANFLVTETLADEPSRLHTVGQYRDVVRSGGDGRLRFWRKVAVYDSPVVLTSLIVPL